ncbi:hypothetical protein TGVAND_438540 [Toxoplasma gondii VAND]|uniref:Uncharacterized protein n=1 Tax=Toxoplasma gondii VAND TaxID=933077 RepID=A0A086PH18_TOXGO|nr:hypothetical protein TGVAND_438540 [Toxoplasma gondii VAND]
MFIEDARLLRAFVSVVCFSSKSTSLREYSTFSSVPLPLQVSSACEDERISQARAPHKNAACLSSVRSSSPLSASSDSSPPFSVLWHLPVSLSFASLPPRKAGSVALTYDRQKSAAAASAKDEEEAQREEEDEEEEEEAEREEEDEDEEEEEAEREEEVLWSLRFERGTCVWGLTRD